MISNVAWASLFARNMFIRPHPAELPDFEPAFTILHAPDFRAIPELDGIRSETFILVNFATGFVLIGGTRYAGEIKKSMFGYLNFVLPTRDVLPMHCSANVGPKGDSRSSSASRAPARRPSRPTIRARSSAMTSIGWSPKGIFNFEGGCYAKVINLSPKAEPEIYAHDHPVRDRARKRRGRRGEPDARR